MSLCSQLCSVCFVHETHRTDLKPSFYSIPVRIRKYVSVGITWAIYSAVIDRSFSQLLTIRSTLCGPQNRHHFVCLNFIPNLTDFQNYFTVRIRKQTVIIRSLKIPPHLKCDATLPCEMSIVLKATIENKDDFCNNIF